MRLDRAIGETARALARCTDSPMFEARAMAAGALGVGISSLPLFEEAEEGALNCMRRMAERRVEGEPLQYILGEWEFMGLPFYTDSRALIPRQDTETLVELALARKHGRVLDLCCGSGCIGISLARLGGAQVTFSDVSGGCTALTQQNARLNGVGGTFLTGDLFESVEGEFDLICCNPPYIPTGELDSLQRELGHEPRSALDGGEDGLDFYRRIAAQYLDYLRPGGRILLEVGAGQAESVAAMFEGAALHRDLNGILRVVEAEK